MVLSHCALRLSPPSVQKQASSPATEETRAVKTAVHSTARRFSLLFLFHRHAALPSANHRVHAVCLPIHAPIRHLTAKSIPLRTNIVRADRDRSGSDAWARHAKAVQNVKGMSRSRSRDGPTSPDDSFSPPLSSIMQSSTGSLHSRLTHSFHSQKSPLPFCR